MNDAGPSTSAAAPVTEDASPLPPTFNTPSDPSLGLRSTSALRIRVHFIEDLIRNLDIAVYCELSALYYLKCVHPASFSPAAPGAIPGRVRLLRASADPCATL